MHYNFHLVPLFSGIINLLLAIFVLSTNPGRRVNRVFFFLGLALTWWNFGTYWSAGPQSAQKVLLVNRLTMLGASFLPALFYHFGVTVTGLTQNGWKVRLAYVVSGALFVLSLTPYMIESVRPSHVYFRPSAGPAFWFFSLCFFPLAMYGTLSALIKFLHEALPSSTRATKFLFVAVSVQFLGILHDMVPLFGWNNYPGTELRIKTWGSLGAALYGLIVGYSILSDQLLDVRVSISRHTAVMLRLSFLGGIAYVLMLSAGALFPGTFTGQGLFASLIVLFISAAITAQFFPKLFGGLTERLERGFLGDHFEYQDKVAAFIDSPRDADNVQQLLDQAVEVVFGQLSLTAMGIAIVGTDAGTHGRSMRSTNHRQKWVSVLSADSALIAYFKSTGKEAIDPRNGFNNGSEERAACRLLNSESLELALSIGPRPKSPLGVLVVGPKRDGRRLTRLDAELLARLCRNLVLRIDRIAAVQNEELRQANRVKDQFLASINHEIRNPLNGISGIVQMLAAEPLEPRPKFLITSLLACTDQLRSTMDDVLDFTRIESESVTLNTTDVDFVELVRTTCLSCDVSGERLIFTDRPAAGIGVRCDAGKVRQILSNYLGNALKYGVPSGASIALSIDQSKVGFVSAKVRVTSTGPTLESEEIRVLFTALTRGRRARETNAHGTGLGLALCKKLATAMGGRVGVTSELGQTQFWFEAEFPTAPKAPLEEGSCLQKYAGRRALAIEDEPYNRLVLAHFLAQLEISAVWCENGQQAVAAARDRTFDLIFMDWLLPDMEGSELIQKMRETRTAPLPPIIVLSAYSTTSKRAECMALGALAFISKPIDRSKLTAALDLCSFKSGTATEPQNEPTSSDAVVDLSSLIALGNEAVVIESFLEEVSRGFSKLNAIWPDQPSAAGFLAHRLKAQMTLIHAEECASLLELLEQALGERWSSDDIERLIGSIEASLQGVLDRIRNRDSLPENHVQ